MPALKLVGAGPLRSKLSVGEIVKLYAGVLLFGTCVCGREDTWNVIMHMHIRARAYSHILSAHAHAQDTCEFIAIRERQRLHAVGELGNFWLQSVRLEF